MLVLDATVLINFGGVEAFGLLERSVGEPLVVVDEVIVEVHQPPAAARLHVAIRAGTIQRYRLSGNNEFSWAAELTSRRPRLGAGETASLAACFANGWSFASDDREARRLASLFAGSRPIVVTGTIGLLRRAVRREVVDPATAEALYQEMLAKGFRAPIKRLADLLEP